MYLQASATPSHHQHLVLRRILVVVTPRDPHHTTLLTSAHILTLTIVAANTKTKHAHGQLAHLTAI